MMEPRMAFTVRSGLILVCLTMLPFFPAKVHSKPVVLRGQINPTCCPTASNATIPEQVNACFEQMENTFTYCKIHAYILTTKNNAWCVDPRAWWLEKRLKRLEKRGIFCRNLIKQANAS